MINYLSLSCKYISESLGETTVRTRNTSRSHGGKGGSSESFSTTKRMLMTPEEVKNLNNKYCIVIIRGLHPFRDLKYDFSKHPHFSETGNANPKNELSEEFIDTYFNTAPVKKRIPSKKKQQKAVAVIAGKTEYSKDLDGANKILEDNGVTKENMKDKVEPQISSKVNEENKKKVVKGENPVKEAMASDNNETLSDATFMF